MGDSKRSAAFVVCYPVTDRAKNFYEVGIPKLASLINTHEWNGEMIGLSSVGNEEQPRMAPVFFPFVLWWVLGSSCYLRLSLVLSCA